MAREWALAGVPDDELQPPPPPQQPQTPKGKWENFWYHYKWWVIGLSFAAVALLVMLWNFLTRNEYDYHVLLVTNEPVAETQIAMLHAELYKYAEDIDGDGEKEVHIENLYVNPKESKTLAQMVLTNSQSLMTHLAVGDRPFLIFEDSTYDDRIRPALTDGTDLCVPIEGDVSGLVENGTCWDWNGSALQQSGKIKLPEHLYFGVRGAGGLGGISEKELEDNMQLLLAFIEAQTAAE